MNKKKMKKKMLSFDGDIYFGKECSVPFALAASIIILERDDVTPSQNVILFPPEIWLGKTVPT